MEYAYKLKYDLRNVLIPVSKSIWFDNCQDSYIKLSIYVQIFVRTLSDSLKLNKKKLRIKKHDHELLELSFLEKYYYVLWHYSLLVAGVKFNASKI